MSGALFIIGLLIGLGFIGSIAWKLIGGKIALPTLAQPATQSPMFIDASGQQFDITPAAPCPTPHVACKYVAPVVSITEPCQMAATEEAIATVTKNTKRIKTILKDAKQALLAFTEEAPA